MPIFFSSVDLPVRMITSFTNSVYIMQTKSLTHKTVIFCSHFTNKFKSASEQMEASFSYEI